MQGINQLFDQPKPIIGVIHLPPLIGSPQSTQLFHEIRARALSDAETLIDNGIDGVIIENYGDVPFSSDSVEPHTVAALALVADEIRERYPQTPIGLNVLRNDAKSAIAIATVTEANFIRVNVHTGAMLTDQGLIQGKAHETLRYRLFLKSEVKIFADIAVKHAVPLAPIDILASAGDTYHRGLADALIVTGTATGKSTDLDQLKTVKSAVPQASIFAGSGVTTDNLTEVLQYAGGVIVGTSIKRDGVTTNAVDADRVRALIRAREG
ncbi:phosphorybosylanthranilate isomerase [Candidatus Poribacteria bacterium]|nr:MAG: phosphorybosylanthranilate isomerase [Candidatus Poribacteria bacterium]